MAQAMTPDLEVIKYEMEIVYRCPDRETLKLTKSLLKYSVFKIGLVETSPVTLNVTFEANTLDDIKYEYITFVAVKYDGTEVEIVRCNFDVQKVSEYAALFNI
jgi:hypothetical protein